MERAGTATNVIVLPVRTPPEPRPVISEPQPDPQRVLGDFWHATVQQLIAQEAISAMVRELALQSQLVARGADKWLLRIERESLNQGNMRERLNAALRAAGFDIALAVESGPVSDCPARRNMAALAEKQRAAEEMIHNLPFVQAMMRDFGAKIIPGTIRPS